MHGLKGAVAEAEAASYHCFPSQDPDHRSLEHALDEWGSFNNRRFCKPGIWIPKQGRAGPRQLPSRESVPSSCTTTTTTTRSERQVSFCTSARGGLVDPEGPFLAPQFWDGPRRPTLRRFGGTAASGNRPMERPGPDESMPGVSWSFSLATPSGSQSPNLNWVGVEGGMQREKGQQLTAEETRVYSHSPGKAAHIRDLCAHALTRTHTHT